jgi:hypothetical protein
MGNSQDSTEVRAADSEAKLAVCVAALKEIVETLDPIDFAHWVATARAALKQAGELEETK